MGYSTHLQLLRNVRFPAAMKLPTILLAEDDDGHAYLIKSCLKKAGFHNDVIRFDDGEETLGYLLDTEGLSAKEDGACVLLLDVQMPKVDGLEVLRRVRHNPALREIPVIVISTSDDPVDVRRCRDVGCNLYFPKPTNWNRFVSDLGCLAQWLKPKSAARARNSRYSPPALTIAPEPFSPPTPGFAEPIPV